MTGETRTIVAHVQRVLMGHSARAQIQAVGAEGHELKLEVPIEAVREFESGAPAMLVVSWSLHALPLAAASPAPAAPSTPLSADEEFDALMKRQKPAAAPEPDYGVPTTTGSGTPAPPTTQDSTAARQLASMLGLRVE